MTHGSAGRLLTALYTFLALAAGARAVVQIATRLSAAPAAYLLSAAAGAVYLLIAVALRMRGERWRRVALVACVAELAGVLLVGAVTVASPGLLGDDSVWTDFGAGYGLVPVVLPVAALWWMRRDGSPLAARYHRPAPRATKGL